MIEKQYTYLYKRTVQNVLKPLKKKWKSKSYSVVIERLGYEWAEMKKEKKENPIAFVGDNIKKILENK